jgi:hypothetical protein
MKRRDFFGTLGLGSAALMTPAFGGASATRAQEQEHGKHDDAQLEGHRANAVVNFGQWKTDPPIDRFALPAQPPAANNHGVFPFSVKIQEGGSVSFIISGVHQIVVYGPGTELADVTVGIPEAGVPPLINDPNNRIYRGPDPRPATVPRDRVESVHFPHSGRYLVVCGVLPHFNEGMHGFVEVKN